MSQRTLVWMAAKPWHWVLAASESEPGEEVSVLGVM